MCNFGHAPKGGNRATPTHTEPHLLKLIKSSKVNHVEIREMISSCISYQNIIHQQKYKYNSSQFEY